MILARSPRPSQALKAIAAAAAILWTPQVSNGELVLHVDFEQSSDLARDVSGNDASGVIIQIVPTGVSPGGSLTHTSDAAVGNGAGVFNPMDSGTNGLAIEYADSELPNLGTDENFAISYWVKPTTTYLNYDPNHAMFSAVATGAGASFSFQIENKGDTSEGQIGVARFSGPFFEAPLIDPSTNLAPGVWQNVAAVSNGQNGRVQIFVDGALTQEVDSLATAGFSTGLALNEVYLATNRGQNKLFQGLMDDVRVYDTAAVSELLSITNSLIPRLVVDRDNGTASISIPASGSPEQITSYTITSANGVLDPAQWQPIAGGIGSPDSLSENFAAMNVVPGTPISLGEVWRKGPFEDLYATALLGDGATSLTLPVAFEGNGGNAFRFGDIFDTGDGVDLDDWVQFKSGQGASLSGLSRIDAYRSGDLDGDGDNDGIDFALFEEAYDAANFPGALRAALTVPEPSSVCLVGLIGIGLFVRKNRRVARLLVATCCLMAMTAPLASAQLLVYDGFDTSTLPAASDLDGTLGGLTSFGWDTNRWTDTVGLNNQPFGSQSEGLANFPGLKSVEGFATRPARNQRTAINRELGATELETLTAEGSEFWFSIIVANRDTPDQDDEAVFLFAETPIVDFRDVDFANGFISQGGQPVPVAPFRSIGIMFDDGDPSGSTGTDVGGRDGDAIYAVYTDASGQNAVYSDGEFAIGDANEPHLVIGHVTWGAEGADHQYDIYAMGIEDIVDPLAPVQLPAQPFGSLTIPSASVLPGDLNTVGFAGAKLPAYDELRFGLTAADVIPSVERMTLEVDVSLGTITLKNESPESFDIDYLAITSESGSLISANWDSLSSNPSFPTGNNDGSGWEEGSNNNANQLIESYLLGATTIAPNDEILLGNAFTPSGSRDLALSFHLDSAGASVVGGVVKYVGLPVLLADFDGDGDVDADDLDGPVDGWQARYGVDLAGQDFIAWQRELGMGAALENVAAVPEPASFALFGSSLMALAYRRQIVD
ncbi:PEP-CTERM sorting domain-containing protein [Pirellulales bacterium]|nr:PEP-CTERM sorting domain-containing protein [Pirellulales bacterium]